MISNIELNSTVQENILTVDGGRDELHLNISEVPSENTLNIGVDEGGTSIELNSNIEENTLTINGVGDELHLNISEVSSENTLNIGVNECGPSDVYLRGEIDNKLEEIEHKRITFTATEGQTGFDIGTDIWRIDNVTRNGIDLDPACFSIISPYIIYEDTLNGGSKLEQGDILIFNYL